LIVVLLLLWFGLTPIGVPFLVGAVLGNLVGVDALDAAALVVYGLISFGPFAAVARLVRRREGMVDVAALASGLAVASGYLTLRAGIGTLLPRPDVLTPLDSRYAVAALRAGILLPYAVTAAWLAPRLAGRSGRSMREWLGLRRCRWGTWFLALAAAGLLTVPWPLTGALGDSLTSLAVGVEVLATIVPQVLLFWGVIFVLLTASFPETRGAAATAILVYALSTLGRALPGGGRAAASNMLFLLPLGFLLAEMRARGDSTLPLLPLAFLYRLVPALFVDPRDAVGGGIPELQHVLSYLVVFLAASTLALLLWLGRRVVGKRPGSGAADGEGERAGSRVALALTAVAAWGLWAGLYVFAGEPGFFNHGFLIVFDQQADLASAYEISGREQRIGAVYSSLVETAEASQEGIRRELDGLDVPYRPHYVINMIRVDGHRRLMGRFAGRPEVAEVILNPNVRRYPRRLPLPYAGGGSATGVQGNLKAIHADAAWALGVRGEGIVVGGQDSGYDWEHPALRPRYRGWDGEEAHHDYNWHDAWGDAQEPFDDDSHGTHTMGTVLGDDGGENQVGVAPQATWIGCRNMRRGIGNPGSYAECMEFLLAPYPLNGDPFIDGDVGRAPHVINNSWGCPRWEGCFPETLRPAVEALRAAGIMMVVSAGNEGPACDTVDAPPANYDASFSVGAATEAGDVVGFSSRGPAEGLIKPDIAAPGQQVRSSVPGGGYGTAGGTSMAGPHVAGVVALIWSADGSLIGDIDATEDLLCRAAVARPVSQSCAAITVPEGVFAAAMTPPPCACGGVTGVPNNVYGCGLVDAEAAVRAILER
jgi:subtilisin family serine protease